MIMVTGIGWWRREASGCLLSSKESKETGQGVFSSQFKNFGRLDRDSKAAAYAVALALKDASMDYPLAPGLTAGICGGGPEGCLGADLLYFRDYVDCGRTLGRGNYFIYTLPTSPLAECAIHFGLEGPVLYAAGAPSPLAGPLECAMNAIGDAQADAMLAGFVSDDGAVFLLLSPPEKAGQKNCLRPEDVMDVMKKRQGANDMTGALGLLDNMIKERGIRTAV